MINILESLDNGLFEYDAALVKIYCLYYAYKDKEKIVSFFKQTDEKGIITALISVSAENANLWCKETADTEEIKSFFDFLSVSDVFTSKQTGKKLKFSLLKHCFFMGIRQKVFGEKCFVNEETGRKVLELLKTGLCVKNDNEFLSDFTYRLFHSAAGFCLNENGAGIIFKSDICAFIGGLAVIPEKRNKGFGNDILNSLKKQSTSENLFVCCEEKNIGFYKKNGFAVLGEAGNFGVR